MVQVGEISVKAKVNTTELDSGTRKVQSRFKEMDASGKMAESSFGRIGSTLGSIGAGLATVGTASIAAIGGLASKAPALSGAFAQMKVTTGELSRFLGEQFKGTANTISEKYQGLVNMIKSKPLETEFSIKGLAALAGTGLAVKGAGAVGLTGAVGGLAGAGAGVGGAIIGGSILSVLLTKLGSQFAIRKAEESGKLGEEGTLRGDVGRVAVGGVSGSLLGVPGVGMFLGMAEAIKGLFSGRKNNDELSVGTDPYKTNRRSEELSWEYNN